MGIKKVGNHYWFPTFDSIRFTFYKLNKNVRILHDKQKVYL